MPTPKRGFNIRRTYRKGTTQFVTIKQKDGNDRRVRVANASEVTVRKIGEMPQDLDLVMKEDHRSPSAENADR